MSQVYHPFLLRLRPLTLEESTRPTLHAQSCAKGRPQGSTKAQRRQIQVNECICMDSIVVAYMKEVTESKSERRKVQRGSLKRIIDQKKIEFGVT